MLRSGPAGRRAAAALGFTVWLAACGGGGSGGAVPPPAPDTTPPATPTGLTATASSAVRVDLSWTAATDTGGAGLAGYRVIRDGTEIVSVGAAVTNHRDDTVEGGRSYRYTVRAFDAATPANLSAESAPATVTTPTQPVAGLDRRPANASCIAPPRPQPAAGIRLVRAFPALGFDTPVGLYQARNDGSRWFVLEQGGRIRAFPNDPAVQPADVRTLLDISARVNFSGEQGLLGMALHPDWPTTPHVYVYYSVRNASPIENRVARFTSNDGGLTLEAASEQPVLRLVKNQSNGNHNGGAIAFGSDGYLYIGTGDGGGGGDPQGNAQDLNVLFGKMLRLDVSPATGYAIPGGAGGNPHAGNAQCTNGSGSAPCPEIYAYGLRNPWRFSFDRVTGDLWVGDVGQNTREEIDVVTRGGNYGWNTREGSLCFSPATGCATAGLVDPLVEYGRDAGASVTGGFVYRGARLPALVGRYLFADYVSSRLFVFDPPSPLAAANPRVVLGPGDAPVTAPQNVAAFAEDADGELYVVGYGGALYSLEAATAGTDTLPTRLSETGCVDPGDPTQPAGGLVPYAPNAAFWSDGADKARWLALPDGATITPQAGGDWDLPSGAVLMKSFRLDDRLIETRLFMRHPDGVWAGYTYEWNTAQTEATRVVGGRVRTIGAQTWIYPSESECLQCHTEIAGRSLGLETAQLNGALTYPQTGRTAQQITTLNAIGLFDPPITSAPDALPRYPDPQDAAGTLALRARAYLHTNCSSCHRPGGPTSSGMDLRYSTDIAQAGVCDVAPSGDALGIANARLVAPGDPARSVLLARMNRRGAAQMPPVGTTVVDSAGVALLRDWIQGLAAGCE